MGLISLSWRVLSPPLLLPLIKWVVKIFLATAPVILHCTSQLLAAEILKDHYYFFNERGKALLKEETKQRLHLKAYHIAAFFFFFGPFNLFEIMGFFFPFVSESILAVIFLQIREFRGIKKRSKTANAKANQTEKEQYKEQNDSIRIHIPIFDEILEEMNRTDSKLLSPEGKFLA